MKGRTEMVEEMIQAINARSEAEWPARVQARMAMAEAARRQQIRWDNMTKENKRMEFYKSILEMGLSILIFVVFAVMMAILQ